VQWLPVGSSASTLQIKKVAKTFKEQWNEIIAWFDSKLSNGLVEATVIPGVDIDQLNKGVCNFMFRTNYPDFAGLNTFQSVAYFSTGITTIFVLEES